MNESFKVDPKRPEFCDYSCASDGCHGTPGICRVLEDKDALTANDIKKRNQDPLCDGASASIAPK